MLIFMSLAAENTMHTDENKKFDKRNIERNIKDGIITQKDYEIYLSKLPDVSDKLFYIEDSLAETEHLVPKTKEETEGRKRGNKKRTKGKGK
jgi:hypothetical protein